MGQVWSVSRWRSWDRAWRWAWFGAMLLCASGGWAQGGEGERLQQLSVAQQAALAGGDGGQVLETSRALGAEAARVLGELAAKGGRMGEAERWTKESLGLKESEEVRLGLVAAEARAGRTAEADAAAEEVVRVEGESARLRLELGAALHGAGSLNGTIRQLQRAVVLEPGSAGAHLALGSAFWELCFFQYNADSLREFGEAQRLEPGNALANFDLGSVLSQYARYGESRGFLARAAELEPASPDAVLQMGMDAWAQGQVDEAATELRRAVERTGAAVERNNYQVRRALALLSRIDLQAGRTEEAVKEAEAAEALRHKVGGSAKVGAITESVGMVTAVSPVHSGAMPARGAAGGELTELEGQLRGVLAQSLNDAGTALARQKDYTGALPLFRQAVEADASLPGAERNLGLAAFHAGEWKEAVEALGKAVAAQPGDALAARDLEEARGHLGTS